MLHARARHLTGDRRDRLVDLAIAMHPGDKGRTLAKHSKALEKASKRPKRLRKGETQQDADAQTALKHLLG